MNLNIVSVFYCLFGNIIFIFFFNFKKKLYFVTGTAPSLHKSDNVSIGSNNSIQSNRGRRSKRSRKSKKYRKIKTRESSSDNSDYVASSNNGSESSDRESVIEHSPERSRSRHRVSNKRRKNSTKKRKKKKSKKKQSAENDIIKGVQQQ